MKGSLIPYRDGWRVYVSGGTDPGTGKRVRRTKFVRGTKKEAREWLTKLQSDFDTGKSVRRGSRTLQNFIEAWWPMKVLAISPTTARGYRSLIDKYVLPEFGSIPIQAVGKERVESLLRRLVKTGLTGQASHIYVLIRMIYNAAIKQDQAAINPMHSIDKPKTVRKEMSVLVPGDWQVVRDHLIVNESWALLPLTILITTGVRRSELAGLRWTDFDETRQILHIQRSYHNVRGGQGVVRETKTNRSRRAIALDPNTSMALSTHKTISSRTAAMGDRKLRQDDHIFTRADGRPWRPDTYSKLWARMMKVLGEQLTATPRLHDLRHTSASLLLASGADPKLISSRLGHSSVAFTMDTYAHLMPEANSDAAEKLADLLNSGTKVAHKLAHSPSDSRSSSG